MGLTKTPAANAANAPIMEIYEEDDKIILELFGDKVTTYQTDDDA